MAPPLFSIVIPTRERAETLRYCLNTCLAQDYDNYEIIVCDNFSSSATREIVEEAGSSKIKYIRTEGPLGMSANWELALSNATGVYINILGDDDGMMPFALRELARLVDEYKSPRAIHWRCGHYNWPTIVIPEEANYLALPLARHVEVYDGKKQLLRAARREIGPDSLPMIYTSVIHRDVIESHRAAAGGRVFLNRFPDVYSGYAFAFLCGTYLSTSVPMHIAGLSGMSNGARTLMGPDALDLSNEFFSMQEQSGYQLHSTTPKMSSYSAALDDSFQFAKDALFANDTELTLDRKQMVLRHLASIVSENPVTRQKIKDEIRASILDRSDLIEWFDNEAPDLKPSPPFRMKPKRLGFDGTYLLLDTAKLNINNIEDAVKFSTIVLADDQKKLKYDLRDLSQYVSDLVECRALLADRTRRLEDVSSRLVDCTRRLDEGISMRFKKAVYRAFEGRFR